MKKLKKKLKIQISKNMVVKIHLLTEMLNKKLKNLILKD
jgi:hypothetical protein